MLWKMKDSLIAVFLLVPALLCQNQPSCANLDCQKGYECDERSISCVPVSCEAETACEDFESCIQSTETCTEEGPCPQFSCMNKCAFIRCSPWSECDPFTATCVPVSCQAFQACPQGFDCVEEEKMCIRAPCPQFSCTPAEQESGCTTNCGISVPNFSFYENDGTDYCKNCVCLLNGYSFCFPFGDCDDDETLSECEIETDECDEKKLCEDPGNYGCDIESKKCIAIDCGAIDACKEEETCIPTQRLCESLPCPQFVCA